MPASADCKQQTDSLIDVNLKNFLPKRLDLRAILLALHFEREIFHAVRFATHFVIAFVADGLAAFIDRATNIEMAISDTVRPPLPGSNRKRGRRNENCQAEQAKNGEFFQERNPPQHPVGRISCGGSKNQELICQCERELRPSTTTCRFPERFR